MKGQKREKRALSKIKLAGNRDYLLPSEISKETVKEMPMDMLYRTHVKLHKLSKDSLSSVEKEHKLVADEILNRGILHHTWDELDLVYKS
jgi:hypothetical protein